MVGCLEKSVRVVVVAHFIDGLLDGGWFAVLVSYLGETLEQLILGDELI